MGESGNMKESPPIIAAVDFSSSSSMVLTHAAKLAAASGQRLIAVHVIRESRLRDWQETMGVEASALDRVLELTRNLQELVNESCGNVVPEVVVRIGRPYQAIRDIVNAERADLLVLGAHDVAKRRLGPVAAHCARSIPADVLILRDWQGQQIHRIAACVDFSLSSAAGLSRAIEIARVHQASLEIIHVMFPPNRDPWGRVLEPRVDDETSYETRVMERVHGRMNAFLAPFTGHLDAIESNTLCLEGESPAAAIAAHVEAEGIDLTVMGSHTGSWVEEFVLGSNTERLMHDSTSSVLVARGRKPGESVPDS